MNMYMRALAAVAAGTLLATAGFAQSAKEVRGGSPYVEIKNEPAPKLIVDPPLPEGLALGVFWAQYRVENLRIVPVFGEGALQVSPRIGHLHVQVDDLPWWWADPSDSNTIDIAGLPPGQHKVKIDLVDANHNAFPGQSKVMTFTIPEKTSTQVGHSHGVPAASASSTIAPLPKGVKVLARVRLDGTPITRMYTQREYGHTFLYIEHGELSLTSVDVTKKQSPRIVEHKPAKVEPVRYEPLSEGGTIEIWPRHVIAGVDSLGGNGVSNAVLKSSDPNDAELLQAFDAENNNLVNRNSHLAYFASDSQLLIVQDNRPVRLNLTNYAD